MEENSVARAIWPILTGVILVLILGIFVAPMQKLEHEIEIKVGSSAFILLAAVFFPYPQKAGERCFCPPHYQSDYYFRSPGRKNLGKAAGGNPYGVPAAGRMDIDCLSILAGLPNRDEKNFW